MSIMKDIFHIQCHLWLIGGSIESRCKRKMLGGQYKNWIARSGKVKNTCDDIVDDDNYNNSDNININNNK